MNSQPPDNLSAKADGDSNASYLREALRLSELSIAEQHNTLGPIERKAVLLVTLYIAIIAYLLSLAGSAANAETAILVFLIASFLTAVFIGISVLHVGKFGVSGADAKFLTQERINQNFEKMATELLEHYQAIFDLNKKVLNRKKFLLNLSFGWGLVTGVVMVFLWGVRAFFYTPGIIPYLFP